MKRGIFLKLLYIIFILIGVSSNTYSQTVVQWYTSMGDFRAQLREDLVPVTAQNFIDLSDAEFYDDLIFHRVISGFMIQDGCPNGNGTGGPGYSFDDEFHPDLRHDEPGILSMANSGPNTNGSQYFITVAPTEWLNDAHAVFGKIIDGMDVVYAISEVETYSNDRPIIDVVIDSIRVVEGDPMIELTAPLAGSKWNGALVNEITWNSGFIADVKIEFSSNNGQSWTNIIESTSANTRSYMWSASNIISDECLVRISDVTNPDVFSITETPFTLCSLDLESPDGFETFLVGQAAEIVWSSEFVEDVSLFYKASEAGEYVLIEEGIPAEDMSYEWIPEVATDWCKIRIVEDLYPDVADESGFKFFVFRLDLLSPAGGEDIEGESEFDISWDSEIISSVKIKFSADNGETWETIINSTSASAEVYSWTVPNINADECYIMLAHPSASDVYTINQNPFSIHEAVGIEDYDFTNELNLALFPNPVNEEISISFYKPEGWANENTIEIYNTKGQLVYSKKEMSSSSRDQDITLNLQSLPQGLYLLKLVNKERSLSQKFIKSEK